MAARLPTDEQQLKKSTKLPGPGKYNAIEICGKDLVHSLYKSQSKFSFGKAHDRFQVPTKKMQSPSPSQYMPKNNLNENFNSTFVKSGQTVIGTSKYSVLDQHFNSSNKTPGPGQYNRFSDFSGLEK